MASSVSWKSNQVGTIPGQKQSLVVTFKKRDENKVTVSYSFHASSLGSDPYTYNQRHNKVTIWVGGTSKSFTYQMTGYPSSTSKSGTFSVTNVGNTTTSLNVQYRNQRVWVDGKNPGDPRSTGVHGKSSIGKLTIPSNVKYSITYNKGYDGGNISNIPANQNGVFKGTSYKIPSNILVDNNNHYVFKGGYTTSKDSDINTKSVAFNTNSTQKLSNNITYYACWSPQTYVYTFYTNNNCVKEYKDLKLNCLYTQLPIQLKNLDDLADNNINSEYYLQGYRFNGWKSTKGNVDLPELKSTIDSSTNFYPNWEAIESKIIFNYGFNDYNREINYKYDSVFDFKRALLDESGKETINTLLRPGYKLIGWTPDKSISNIVYQPSKSPEVTYKFNSQSKISYYPSTFSNKDFETNGLNLYAVWEYYTTLFVYTNNTFKIAIPYVYSKNDNGNTQWNISLAHCYTKIRDEQNPSWKL